LPAFYPSLLASDVIGRGTKNVRKTQKKACQKFLSAINPWGTQPEKVLTLAAVSLQPTLHTENPSTSTTTHEKEIRFTISLL